VVVLGGDQGARVEDGIEGRLLERDEAGDGLVRVLQGGRRLGELDVDDDRLEAESFHHIDLDDRLLGRIEAEGRRREQRQQQGEDRDQQTGVPQLHGDSFLWD